MIVRPNGSEPQMVLRLEYPSDGVVILTASMVGSEERHTLMVFNVGSVPNGADPLAQRPTTLIAKTVPIDPYLPIEMSGACHMVVRINE